MEYPKSTYYDATEIPVETLEEIIKDIHKQGFGAAGPAITSYDIYRWIAREWAHRIGARWPHLAYLRCTFEHRNGTSIYGAPHCNTVDMILHKYFNSCVCDNDDYWYKKSMSLKSVTRWLGVS